MVSFRLQHVIAVNDMPKDCLRIGSRETDRRPREADERSVRQRPPKLMRETFRQPVLAAMRFIGNDNEIAPGRKGWVHDFRFTQLKLLDRRENDLASLAREQRPQL